MKILAKGSTCGLVKASLLGASCSGLLVAPSASLAGNEPTRPLQYLVASENEEISLDIVTLLDAYTLIYDGDFGRKGHERSQLIFIQKEDAIISGKISASALEGIEGGVKESLLAAKSDSDSCFIETFPIQGGWPLTMVVSTTIDNLNQSLQCLTVGLSYHITGRLPRDLSQPWQITYTDLIASGTSDK